MEALIEKRFLLMLSILMLGVSIVSGILGIAVAAGAFPDSTKWEATLWFAIMGLTFFDFMGMRPPPFDSLSANVQLHDSDDSATIYGTRVTGALLRAWTQPTLEGHWFRVVKKEHDGHVTIERMYYVEKDPR